METKKRTGPDSVRAGVIRRAGQILFSLVLEVVLLFFSSGNLAWGWAWVLIGINLLVVAVTSFLMRHKQETIAERSRLAGQRGWDRVISYLWALSYLILVLVVAGLDERFQWSRLGLLWHLLGGAGYVLGFVLLSWAMIANAYFATIVRIQSDRGHQVCNEGPYRFVRHPGYVGSILESLCVPLLLGSFWALIPGVFAAGLMLARTALEDRTLQAELDGYAEYARRTRYRLLPGVW